MSRGGTTLYVSGFSQGTRARDLAFEFERFGRLVRCDIPAPRSASSRLFAFVEYESRRDAEDAYYDMHNKRMGRDDILKIEWARTPPSAAWRFDAGRERERGGSRRTPPRRRSGSPAPRRREYSPRKDDRRERDHDRGGDRDRSRSPGRERDRERERDRDDNDDREMKDVRRDDDDRDNGANGHSKESPQPHDELDTAE